MCMLTLYFIQRQTLSVCIFFYLCTPLLARINHKIKTNTGCHKKNLQGSFFYRKVNYASPNARSPPGGGAGSQPCAGVSSRADTLFESCGWFPGGFYGKMEPIFARFRFLVGFMYSKTPSAAIFLLNFSENHLWISNKVSDWAETFTSVCDL
uniref:Putative secreted protein n=1 Tax=Ixodes ricinus TaxID=34613 RepID=A0A6B0UVN8_IXORI